MWIKFRVQCHKYVLLEHGHFHWFSVLSMAKFVLRQQSWIAVAEIIWHARPKTFNIWPPTKNICQCLPQLAIPVLYWASSSSLSQAGFHHWLIHSFVKKLWKCNIKKNVQIYNDREWWIFKTVLFFNGLSTSPWIAILLYTSILLIFKKFFIYIGVQLINNAVLVSGVWKSDSGICIRISILFQFFFHLGFYKILSIFTCAVFAICKIDNQRGPVHL